jgi:pilus assembly protein CpaC
MPALISLAAVLLAGTVRAAAQNAESLTLAVGEQRVLSSDGVASYSEGVEGIVDVRLTQDGAHFVIVGKRAGATSLLLMRANGQEQHYRIVVTQPAEPTGGAAAVGGVADSVARRDNIRLDFYFVQLSEDYRHGLGVAWPASVGGGSLSASFDLKAGAFSEATAAVTDQVLPRLDMAQSKGWAKLLRQAAVITANGAEATFGGGGELNVPIEGGLSASIRQIEFGSKIRVLPRYDRESGRIELQIHADVSDLASDQGTGVPGRITSTLDSLVNLELGQSLVIAGLSARSESTSHTGLPLLSQIPILGGLFGSHANRSEGTENLIFIVPTVVDSVSLPSRESLREALRVFRDYDGNLEEAQLRQRTQEPRTTREPAP